jgi:glucosamine--fructose-6-phosphate aminotransferase (isomerizing)
MEGAIAVAVVFERFPSTLFAARINSPLVIGSSGEGHYLSSDANAFSTDITRVYHLSDGEIARLTNDEVVMEDPTGTPKTPAWSTRRSYELTSSKGRYEHYMLKEIHEQPKVLNRIIDHYMDPQKNCFSIPYLPFDAAKLQRLTILACGSSYFAGMMGKAWLEKYAGLAVDLDIASEYVHRNTPQNPDEPVILISQSGETADTLAALRYAKRNGRPVVSVVNVPDSTMALESDLALPTLAGPEVGVASTKAFTAQMAVLAVFATHLASQRTQIEPVEGSLIVADLQQTCSDVERILTMTQSVEAAASLFQDKQTALFIGRGPPMHWQKKAP